jgi:hypothetical protein
MSQHHSTLCQGWNPKWMLPRSCHKALLLMVFAIPRLNRCCQEGWVHTPDVVHCVAFLAVQTLLASLHGLLAFGAQRILAAILTHQLLAKGHKLAVLAGAVHHVLGKREPFCDLCISNDRKATTSNSRTFADWCHPDRETTEPRSWREPGWWVADSCRRQGAPSCPNTTCKTIQCQMGRMTAADPGRAGGTSEGTPRNR